MATDTKDTAEKTDAAKAAAAKKGGKEKGTVKVEVLTRIRTGREKGEDGKPGRAIYVEEGEETTMQIDEAEVAEARGIVKILEGRKARAAAAAE